MTSLSSLKSRIIEQRIPACSVDSNASKISNIPFSFTKNASSRTFVIKNRSEADVDCLLKKPLIKICGITNTVDAEFAASNGADFIGMILWPNAKRSVSLSLAKEISMAARMNGAEPVGVFVDEDADTIARVCEATNVSIAQLHGDKARHSLQFLNKDIKVTYVLQADKLGKVLTLIPTSNYDLNQVEWVLIDGMQGGSGEKFNWENLQVPSGVSKRGWALAGGLNPDNVSEANRILRPDMVDISSGVCDSGGIFKDHEIVKKFISRARD